MAATPFGTQTLAETEHWARFFGEDWQRDFPAQMHSGVTGDDGTPGWTVDFSRWLDGAGDEERRRTTRAFRRLRRISPREYEVAYRVLILGESFEEVSRWLTQRALRNNIPLPASRDIHYRPKDAVAIFIAAIDYVRFCW